MLIDDKYKIPRIILGTMLSAHRGIVCKQVHKNKTRLSEWVNIVVASHVPYVIR